MHTTPRVLIVEDERALAIAFAAAVRQSGAASELAPAVLTSHVAVPHPWSVLPVFFTQSGFLREESRPDALNVANDFATWSGERHRS